jgi:hypothetical protein
MMGAPCQLFKVLSYVAAPDAETRGSRIKGGASGSGIFQHILYPAFMPALAVRGTSWF